jgi:release factor glutamine methyltransferase
MKQETFQSILTWGTYYLKQHDISNPRFEAELLLSNVLGIDRVQLLVKSEHIVTASQKSKFIRFIEQRSQHKPYAQIIGHKEFMGLDFLVTPDVLIPRPDTENIVEEALSVMQHMHQKKINILDLCCGSGAIGIALAKYEKRAVVTGSDLSEKAINIAKQNAKRNKVNMTFLQSNLFQNISDCFDIIVTNPPYIPTQMIKKLSEDVKNYEPSIALDGGETGLSFYKKIFNNASKYLQNEGYLICECGWDQVEDITDIAECNLFNVQRIIHDLANLDRGLVCKSINPN